ncbi:unnamed protein product [Orchesella dallaii]|uniref:Uncharacterized protein n=1 Tax=Orchesella dallaii TaxID=48710 RepID=A0ABP1S3X1_9HEXA
MAFPNISIVVLVTIVSIRCSVLTLSNDVQFLLKGLTGCHFKLWLTTYRGHSDFETVKAITNFLADTVSFSIASFEFFNSSLLIINPAQNHQSPQRFHSCFVHNYIQDTLSNLISYHFLMRKMQTSERVGERPDYFLFFEDPAMPSMLHHQQKIKFYMKTLPGTFAMNHVYSIENLTYLYAICISCTGSSSSKSEGYKIMNRIRFPAIPDTNSLKKVWIEMYSNLNKAYIATDLTRSEKNVHPRETCNFHRAHLSRYPTSDACIHLLLSKKLNYSYNEFRRGSPITSSIHIHGTIRTTNFLNAINYKAMVSTELHRWEWIPYGMRFRPYAYIVVKEKPPRFKGAITAPFRIPVWILLVVCELSLFAATIVAILVLQNEWIDFHQVLIFIASSGVDQSLPTTFRRRIPGTSLSLSVCWFIWYIMMVVVTSVYKGKVFSFLTKTAEPVWPLNLKQLVHTSYTLMTLTSHLVVGGYSNIPSKRSTFREIVLPEIMQGEPGVDYPVEYYLLNRTVLYYKKPDYDLVTKVILNEKRKKLIPTISKVNATSIITDSGNMDDVSKDFKVPSIRFSIVDTQLNVDKLALAFRIFLEDSSVAVSNSILIPGYITRLPWSVEKNYFYPLFINGLSQLQESGIFDRWEKYCDRLEVRSFLLEIDYQLRKMNYNASVIMNVKPEYWYNFIFSSSQGFIKSPESIVLTFKLFSIVLTVCGSAIGLSVGVLVIEIISKSKALIRLLRLRHLRSTPVTKFNW